MSKIVEQLPQPSHFWWMSAEALIACGIRDSIMHKILETRRTFHAPAVEKELHERDVQVITKLDANYPRRLRHIEAPPFVLYVRGQIHSLDEERSLAVVGTRRASSYGARVTKELVRDLVRTADVSIVSGLARGIDRCAHEATVAAGGSTIAVIGGGHAELYPPEHEELARAICLKGAVVSEYYPTILPHRGHFPSRNRIIVGLCDGVLVVEAPLKSGALISANIALDAGREVLSVPGPITSQVCTGTNDLLRQGAHVVTAAVDVLDVFPEWRFTELRSSTGTRVEPTADSEVSETDLRDFLRGGSSMNELLQQFPHRASTLHATLLSWVLNGFIEETEPGHYVWLGK